MLPSANAWAQALAAHLTFMLCALLPTSILLYHIVPGRARTLMGIVIALASGAGTPMVIEHFRASHSVSWMTAFLASTFGFHAFFKSLAAAFGSYPEGADANLGTWVLWFTSLPEPRFAKGKLLRAPGGSFSKRVLLFLLKALSLVVILSGLQNSPRGAPFGDDSTWARCMLNGGVHLWLVFLWAAFCLDVGNILVLLQGASADPGFRNPLLASRSFKEAWGERWNLPVHLFLKRSVYTPARSCGISRVPAALITFFCSGLLHEYNFSIHNHEAYQPGHATVFFMTMGMMMMMEDTVGRAVPAVVQRTWNALPDAMIAMLIQSTVLPFFTPLFSEAGSKLACSNLWQNLYRTSSATALSRGTPCDARLFRRL